MNEIFGVLTLGWNSDMGWEYWALYTLLAFWEAFLLLNGLARMAGKRYRGARHFLLVLLGAAAITAWDLFALRASLPFFLTFFVPPGFVILYSKLLCTQSLLCRCAASELAFAVSQTFGYLLIFLQEYLNWFLISAINNRSFRDDGGLGSLLRNTPPSALFSYWNLILEAVGYPILYLCLRWALPKFQQLQKRHYVSLFGLSAAAYYVLLSLVTGGGLRNGSVAVLLAFVAILAFSLLIVRLFFLAAHYEEEKQTNDLLHTSNTLMAENYRQLYDVQQARRKELHDFTHHISALHSLAQQGKTEEIAAYTDSLLHSSYQEKSLCHSGNDVVDAVINRKAAEAEEAGIDFRYSVEFPVPAAIDPVDVCAVLANQIDNALDACRQVKEGEGRIDVRVWQQTGRMAFFRVVNTAPGDPFDERGELHSTKKDKSRPHGLGIKSIRDTAQKYHGDLKSSWQEGRFTSTAFLCWEESPPLL